MSTTETPFEGIEEPQDDGWNRPLSGPSMPDAFRSVLVPEGGPFWRRLLAFVGPGFLIAVGYMDPGNWATDIAGGAVYAYALLSVVLLANFTAIYLQALAAKLGIVSGRDLAQACRDAYSRPVAVTLWLSAEVGIVACDVAEVIGAAIALNLLFHIPLTLGVILTGADVLIVLLLQGRGFRWIEALIMTLIGTMMVIFALELSYAHPNWLAALHGFAPRPQIVRDPAMLYIALGILGATVMPHNLYLHSSIIQTRRFGRSFAELKDTIQVAYTESAIALMLALLVNAAILVLAAAAFFRTGHHEVGDIGGAYKLLTPLLGVGLATPIFAVGLLASGQNSTITGTMAGQVILEGFTHFKIAPWLRRLISRLIAIVPCVFITMLAGPHGTSRLLIFSQVVLSVQLSFAVIPLVQFTSDRRKMGPFVNNAAVKALGWSLAAVIALLNIYLVFATFFPHLVPGAS